ncbi:MAG: hypothetical protein WBC33_06990 [Conexibacter sp.]
MLEYGLYRQCYVTLPAALADGGFDVVVEQDNGGIESRSLPADAVVYVADLFVYLGEHLTDEALTAFVALLVRHLLGKRNRARTGVIYGPDGEVLRRFKLPTTPEE